MVMMACLAAGILTGVTSRLAAANPTPLAAYIDSNMSSSSFLSSGVSNSVTVSAGRSSTGLPYLTIG